MKPEYLGGGPFGLGKLHALNGSARLIGTGTYDWGGIINCSIGAASAQTAAMGAPGEYELSADTDGYVLAGSVEDDPTAASSTSRFLPAGAAFHATRGNQLGGSDPQECGWSSHHPAGGRMFGAPG